MISSRTRQLLQILSSADGPETAAHLAQLVKTSKRLIYYDLKTVDQLLEALGAAPTQLQNQGYLLTEGQKEKVSDFLRRKTVIAEEKDRISYIICSVIYPKQVIRIETLAQIFMVSRNTVLHDLYRVRQTLEGYRLSLVNTRKQGYFVEGEVFRRRSVMLYYLQQLLRDVSLSSMEMFDVERVEEYCRRLRAVFRELGTPADEENLKAVACLTLAFDVSAGEAGPTLSDTEGLRRSEEYRLAEKYFPELREENRIGLAVYLLETDGKRDFFSLGAEEEKRLRELSRSLVDVFESVACINLKRKDELAESILSHLRFSSYAARYSVPSINPLMDEMKENYADLYGITKQCCEILKDRFPFPVFDSEITYLAMYFGSFLRRGGRLRTRVNVLIVCPNGRTSSMLLKNEIECQFDNVSVVGAASVPEVSAGTWGRKIDFVISTVDFPCSYPIIPVHPILTAEDRAKIASVLSLSREEGGISKQQFGMLLGIVHKNVDEETYGRIREEMQACLGAGSGSAAAPQSRQAGLLDMLLRFGVRLAGAGAETDWRQAIRETSRGLLEQKYITRSYVEKMISLVEKYGPYIVVSPRIAIAHAQPDDGALGLALSLSVYPQGLSFGPSRVQFLFVLATPNQSDHLHILQNIVLLSEQQDAMDGIAASADGEEALRRFSEFLK